MKKSLIWHALISFFADSGYPKIVFRVGTRSATSTGLTWNGRKNPKTASLFVWTGPIFLKVFHEKIKFFFYLTKKTIIYFFSWDENIF